MKADNRLRIGVLLPTREQAITGDTGMPAILDFARQAEDLGFDAVWTGDSLVARSRLDPFVVLAAAGAVTNRIGLGTAALTPALRHPVVGANMLAALDHATEGRLTVGVGSGFPIPETEEEFALVGLPFTARAARLDDNVRLWRRAWNSRSSDQAPTAYDGKYFTADGLDRLPPPVQPGGPPVWLASSDTPKVLTRVATSYDGWLPFLPSSTAYAVAWDTINELAAEVGRPRGAISAGLYATVCLNTDRDAARRELENYSEHYYGRPLSTMAQIQAYGWGDNEFCTRWLAGYVRAGARNLILRIGSLDPVPQLKELAATVLPAVRAIAEA